MTLIELVLYLALFAIFFVAMINFFFFISDSNQLSGETLKVDRTVIFVTQHLQDTITSSTGVAISPSSSFGVVNGSIYLENENDTNYTLSAGRIQFDNGPETLPITRSDLEVTKFLLEEILDNSDTVIGVQITIEVQSRIDDSVISEFTNSYMYK